MKKEWKKALKIFDDDESQKNGLKILEKLSLLSKGDIDATLIIEDPFGQSKIMDIDVKKEELTEEELKKFKNWFYNIWRKLDKVFLIFKYCMKICRYNIINNN